MRIKQSACYPIFTNDAFSMEDFCAALADIGYAAMEMWKRPENFEEVVDLARSKGLAVASMCGHQGAQNGLNDASNHERIESELRESIDVAAEYGIPGVITFSGNRRAGVTEEEAAAVATDGLRRIAPYAEEKGIDLNMELLNSKVNHPGYQCDRTAWGVAVCERVDSPRVKLLYDIYHMQIMEGDIIRTIRDNLRWIGHFHTAGNPGRNDFDDTQELNYRGICRAIAETGYAGYVGHEFRPKGDPVAALRAAFEVCDVV